MARVLAVRCPACLRKFGGGVSFERHEYIAGDRYRCRSNEDLRSRGFYYDRYGVWHRGPNPSQTSLLTVTDTAIRPPEPKTLARSVDPDTSKAAAWKLSGKAGTMRRRLLACYADGEELTSDEVSLRVGYTAEDGAWKRVSDLLNAGLLEDTGQTRPGRSNRQQRVLRITASGRMALGKVAVA